MKITKLVLLLAALTFVFVGCKGKPFKTEEELETDKVPGEEEQISLTALKLIQLDDGEVDLFAEERGPFPLRPKYIEATYSAPIADCDALKENISLVKDTTPITDINISCTEEGKLQIAFTKNLLPKTEYKLSIKDAEKEITLKTMTLGDVNGDGRADFAVGEPRYNNKRGAVRVFSGKELAADSGTVKQIGPLMQIEEPADNDFFGFSLAMDDINEDGAADIIVGIRGRDSEKGAVAVYSGKELAANNLKLMGPLIKNEGFTGGEKLGYSIVATDLTGDGVMEIVTGAPGKFAGDGWVYAYDGAEFLAGGVKILNEEPEILDIPGTANFGSSLAIAGDINNDGIDDIIVGVPRYNGRGAVVILSGKAGLLRMIGEEPLTIDHIDSMFGASVASGGDFNGDNIPDILVGAPGYNSYHGEVFVYNGADLRVIGYIYSFGSAAESFGSAVAIVDDFNGDGVSDIVVGAPFADSSRGRAYAFSAVGSAQIAFIPSESDGAFLGCTVANAGDINEDGVSDVIVGARGYDSKKGAVSVYDGKELAQHRAVRIGPLITVDDGEAQFGFSVAGGGQ